MTLEKLNAIAKANKINLDHFDEVDCWINEKYTKLYITFAVRENCGYTPRHCGAVTITKSVAAMMKREENEQDYLTQGWTWLYEIKAQA